MSDPLDQSGSEGSYDPRTGLIELNRVYVVSTLAECVTLRVPVQDNPWGLPEFNPRRFTQLPDIGDWRVTINLMGAPGGTDLGETWEINFASEQKPVQAFSDWDQFAKKYGAQYDPKNPDEFTGFAKKIKLGGQLVANPAYGIDNYLSPKAILVVEYNRRTLDTSIWRNLGKIDAPLQPKNFQMPQLVGGRNWLKYSAVPSDRGSLVGHRLEWWLSDEGGWLFDLYASRRG